MYFEVKYIIMDIITRETIIYDNKPITICINNDKIYFKANDIFRALNYRRQMLNMINKEYIFTDDGDDKYLEERGVYQLGFKSRRIHAIKFIDFIYNEIQRIRNEYISDQAIIAAKYLINEPNNDAIIDKRMLESMIQEFKNCLLDFENDLMT